MEDARARKQAYDRVRNIRRRAARDAARGPDPIELLDETTLAYLAGLTDGDGSIYCTRTNRRKTVYPNVTWAMTHRATIDWVAEQLRSRAVVKNNHTLLREGRAEWGMPPVMDGRPSFKVQWKTQVAGSRAQLLCRRMLPYLRTKREQAELVLEFPCDARRAPGHFLPPEIAEQRQDLATRISALNRGR